MRVLVISNYYPPYHQGGYEVSCQCMVDELRRRHHQVLVVTSDWRAKQGTVQDYVRRLLHLHSYKGLKGLPRRVSQFHQAVTGVQDYLTVYHLRQLMQPDVVYIWNMSGLSLAPLTALQRMDVPMVFDLGDYWLVWRAAELSEESSRVKRLYRSAIQGGFQFERLSLKYVLTHSSALKQHYVQNGFLPETITVIPRGLPLEHVAEEPAALDGRQGISLLCVGRLTEDKGMHIAIEAVAHLVHGKQLDAVYLDIVGTGEAEYTKRLQQMVTSFGLESHVCFRGDLPHQDVMGLYRQHLVLLFPAIWVEPFGRVVIEAMAQGLCVVASDRGGPAEHITHRENGLLVPAEDPHAMARAVVDLVQDGDLRDRIRHAAIATVRQRYALDKVADQVEAYLNAVVESSSERL